MPREEMYFFENIHVRLDILRKTDGGWCCDYRMCCPVDVLCRTKLLTLNTVCENNVDMFSLNVRGLVA